MQLFEIHFFTWVPAIGCNLRNWHLLACEICFSLVRVRWNVLCKVGFIQWMWINHPTCYWEADTLPPNYRHNHRTFSRPFYIFWQVLSLPGSKAISVFLSNVIPKECSGFSTCLCKFACQVFKSFSWKLQVLGMFLKTDKVL